ncbi:hypothetical protein B0H15DRAFT_1023718 [Mycena belliarum]|uniref:Uncharacterized protein n=1 Tax=Mycena belliarum TaxID=1033014 RepID=A0AAD6U0E7_9AGAR|nr:hypothetical protein B0H15DRAFT_1023718 [Mycena belliae]
MSFPGRPHRSQHWSPGEQALEGGEEHVFHPALQHAHVGHISSYPVYSSPAHGNHRPVYPSTAPAHFLNPSGYAPAQPSQGPIATSHPPAHAALRCEQCHADTIVEYERTRLHTRCPAVVPEPMGTLSAGRGAAAVVFESRSSGPGGVLVADILAFRDCLVHPGAHVLRASPGDVSVTLTVGNKTFSERIPGNCAHRHITCYNLAWWLAKHLKDDLDNEIRGLYLLSMFTADGQTWTANARYSRSLH